MKALTIFEKEKAGFTDIPEPPSPKEGEAKLKTTPRFLVPGGSKYDFLRSGVFVGSIEGYSEKDKSGVLIKIYKLN